MNEIHSDNTSQFFTHETAEDQLKITLESILDGFISCDTEWRFVYINATAESIIGAHREEVLGKNFWEVFPLTLGTVLEREYRRAAAGETRDFENFYEPWGRWFHNRCFPRKGGGMSVYFQDITERKKTEIKLQENEQRLNFYVDHSPLASIEWDSNFVVTRWTGEAEKIFGWTPAETIGKQIMDLNMIYEEDIPIVENTMVKLTGGGSNYVVSTNRNYSKDGRVIICEWYNTLMYNPDGKMVSVLSQVMDITERKKAEEMLEQNRRLLNATERISRCGGWEWDLKREIMLWTDETYHIHGFTQDVMPQGSQEHINRSIACYNPEDRPAVMEAFWRCVKEGIPYNLEFPFKTVDGRRLWIQTSAQPLLEGNRIVKVIGSIIDITERKHTEIALKTSLAEKEVLLREVHHRVKNNLTSISALLNLQLDYITDTSALNAIKDIDNRIMSMALVHEKLYRSEQMTLIDFKEYLFDLSSHLLNSYGAGSYITCTIDADDIEIVLETAIYIGLIVNELISNAIKHAFPKGQAKTGTNHCEIQVTMKKAEDTFTLIVADNGIGLPPELDWKSSPSLGLRLVSLLGEQQLRGQILLDQSEWTSFTLSFKEQKPKKH